MARTTTPQQFAACLGFDVVAEGGPQIVARCGKGAIVAKISAQVAKLDPWAGARESYIDGRVFYASTTPVFTANDVESLELADSGQVNLVLSAAAAKRFHAATSENVEQYMILRVNDAVTAPRIAAGIPGPKLSLVLQKQKPETVCRP